jgi:phosphoglycerate dehydrogenase-like enzyme
MHVLCTTRRPDPQRARRYGVTMTELDALLRSADVISVHARLTEATRQLLDARRLALLKPGALLVNTARGGLIDQAALVDALRAGRIAGAALDVVEPEPLPADHPLLALDSVILTPHIGAATPEARQRSVEECIENVVAFLAGTHRNVVNSEALR